MNAVNETIIQVSNKQDLPEATTPQLRGRCGRADDSLSRLLRFNCGELLFLVALLRNILLSVQHAPL